MNCTKLIIAVFISIVHQAVNAYARKDGQEKIVTIRSVLKVAEMDSVLHRIRAGMNLNILGCAICISRIYLNEKI